jgi:hypothetical protein
MTPHRIVQYALRTVTVAAAVAVAGCAASPPAESSPESDRSSRIPVQIERTDPPEYRHVPQGTYERSSSAVRIPDDGEGGDGDATHTLPVTPPDIDSLQPDQDEMEDDSAESGG